MTTILSRAYPPSHELDSRSNSIASEFSGSTSTSSSRQPSDSDPDSAISSGLTTPEDEEPDAFNTTHHVPSPFPSSKNLQTNSNGDDGRTPRLGTFDSNSVFDSHLDPEVNSRLEEAHWRLATLSTPKPVFKPGSPGGFQMVRERGRKVAMVGMVPAIVPRFRPATGVTGRKSRHQDRVASVFVRGARNVPSERRIYSLPNRSISIEGSSESDGWSDSNSSEVDGEAVPHMKYYNDNHEMDLDSDVDVASTIAHPGSPLQDFEDTEFTTPLNFESEELPSRCSHPLLDPLFISYTILVGFLILFSPTSLSTPTSFTPLLNKFLPVEPPRRVEYYSECALRHVFVFLAFTFAIAQVFGAEGGVGLVVSVMAPAVLWVWWGVWDEGSPFQGGGDYRGDEAEGDREMIWRVLTRSSQNYHGDLVVSDRMRSVGTKSTYKVGGERGRREYIFAK